MRPLAGSRQHAAADLIGFDALEQGFEVAFAEALVAFALNDLEEDRSDHVFGEDLQEQALAFGGGAIHQDPVGGQSLQVLAMSRHPSLELLVVGVGRLLEGDPVLTHRLDRGEDVAGPQRHVLDPLALVVLEEFLDLRVCVLALVERNADLAAGTGHRLGEKAGLSPLDVEVADFAEVEDPLVEVRPASHLAAMDVVGQVIEVGQAQPRCAR